MKSVWWAQIKAVIRLEIKKTFFARRGLWIYFLAALPILLFAGYAILSASQHNRSVRIAGHESSAFISKKLTTLPTTPLCSRASSSSSFFVWLFSLDVWESS